MTLQGYLPMRRIHYLMECNLDNRNLWVSLNFGLPIYKVHQFCLPREHQSTETNKFRSMLKFIDVEILEDPNHHPPTNQAIIASNNHEVQLYPGKLGYN